MGTNNAEPPVEQLLSELKSPFAITRNRAAQRIGTRQVQDSRIVNALQVMTLQDISPAGRDAARGALQKLQDALPVQAHTEEQSAATDVVTRKRTVWFGDPRTLPRLIVISTILVLSVVLPLVGIQFSSEHFGLAFIVISALYGMVWLLFRHVPFLRNIKEDFQSAMSSKEHDENDLEKKLPGVNSSNI
jgi:hypothetical protein